MNEARHSWREALGLGLLLAWMYCSFFSCGLVAKISVLRSSEHMWLFVGIGMAASAVALIALRRKMPFAGKGASGVAGATLSSAGSLLIWLSFLHDTWNTALTAIGGFMAGAGLAIMAVIWCQRLSGFKVSRLESAVPIAFIFSFAVYFVLLTIKGPLFVAACMLMPIGSMAIAFCCADMWECPFVTECACGSDKPIAGRVKPQLKSMAPLIAMYFLFWVQFSSFRVISSPNVVGDRFMHYLVPFTCAAVVAVGMFLLCLRHVRFLNYSLIYRWSAPLMVLGCGIFAMGPNDFYDYRSVAYAANFLAMFGAQFTVWVVTPKHVCRSGYNPVIAMASFIAAEGLGIACGLAFSLPAIGHEDGLAGVATIVTGAAVLSSMVLGFNPDWFSIGRAKNKLFLAKENAPEGNNAGKTEALSKIGTEEAVDSLRPIPDAWSSETRSPAILQTESIEASLTDLFETQAKKLQQEFGLTERETEICALLLAGRSRPYIRDELIISLNTVHAHARNIFAKCGVHSQQELMSLPEELKATAADDNNAQTRA